MKRTTLLTLLLAAAALLAAACEKSTRDVVRQIVYTVDNNAEQHVTTRTDAEFDALLEQFCHYAESGSTVSFHGAPASRRHKPAVSQRSKDATTYSTTSGDEIKAWMRDMEAAGMTVTVTYNSETGTWNGTAYANASAHQSVGCITYATPYNVAEGAILTFDTVNHIAYITTGHIPSGQMEIHFPTGKYRYIRSGNRLLLHDYYSMTEAFEETLTITPTGGNTLDLTYNYDGPCPADHTHRAQLVPTDLYTLLFCHNEAADVLLHIDRSVYNGGHGQASVRYYDESVYYSPTRPFENGRFSYGVIMTFAEGGPGWEMFFEESYDDLASWLDISNYNGQTELWHIWSEYGSQEAYNPLRDFLFEHIR
ncbi:MAG: hypothetical protein IJ634_04865 [Bacteroidales bacterium]|nr:hypothetical protein [Bacteroidales bacterium]